LRREPHERRRDGAGQGHVRGRHPGADRGRQLRRHRERPAVRDDHPRAARRQLHRRPGRNARRRRRRGARRPRRRLVRPVRRGAGHDDPGAGAGRMKTQLPGPLFFSLVLAASLPAQDRRPVLGVGITVPDVGLLLPINVSPHFRLEPYVLFYSERADYPASGDTVWASHTRVGLAVYSVGHPGETVRVYVGPRLGLLWGTNKLDGPTAGQRSTTAKGWFAGGAI